MRGLLLLLMLLVSGLAEANEKMPTMPVDFDKVDIYLLTVKRGPQVSSLYGHTILRVIDRNNGKDYNFNWGIFDFNADNFVWKFYVGDLNYQLAITDFYATIDYYRRVEKRGVIQDRINLTIQQKETLMKRLIWNALPENVFYQYHQFRNNCSTKPRDYLDEAVAGKIGDYYKNRISSVNFRHHIRQDASPTWWVDVGLDTVSNNLLDAPVSNWQEMFLPMQFRTLLLELPAFDDSGHAIPGKNLLEQSELIVDLPEPPAQVDPYYVIALIVGAGLFFCFVIVLSGMFRDSIPSARGRKVFMTLGITILMFGLWCSLWGTAMTFNWLFSRYPEVQANNLLLIYWPIDWFWVLLGFYYLVKGRPIPAFSRAGKLTVSLGALHILGIILAVLLYGLNVISQNILPHLLIGGIPGLFFYWLILRVGLLRGARQ